MNEIALDPVERLRLTILMDNVTDPLLADAGPVARLSWPKALAGRVPTVAARTTALDDPGTNDNQGDAMGSEAIAAALLHRLTGTCNGIC